MKNRPADLRHEAKAERSLSSRIESAASAAGGGEFAYLSSRLARNENLVFFPTNRTNVGYKVKVRRSITHDVESVTGARSFLAKPEFVAEIFHQGSWMS